jgi:hypothetical protein
MKTFWRKLIRAAGIFAVAAIVGFFLERHAWHPDRHKVDLSDMNEVVAKIRAAELLPGEVREFELKNLLDPESLRPWVTPPMGPIAPPEKGVCHVWAQMTREGHLKVVIETVHHNHGGNYGFAFSDVPLSPIPWADGKGFSIDVPGPMTSVAADGRVNEHWWEVYDNRG